MLKIGFIDSGIGGFSLLKEVNKNVGGCELKYIADNLNAPYGNKTREEVSSLVMNVVKNYLPIDTDVLVVACNTATVTALEELKDRYHFRVFGVSPQLKTPKSDGKKRTLLLATNRTVMENTEKYKEEGVFLYPTSGLATFIEKNYFNKDLLVGEIAKIRDSVLEYDIDSVVLGCTHYSFIREVFQEVFGESVAVYDDNKSVSCEIADYLAHISDVDCEASNEISLVMTRENKEETEKYSEILKEIM